MKKSFLTILLITQPYFVFSMNEAPQPEIPKKPWGQIIREACQVEGSNVFVQGPTTAKRVSITFSDIEHGKLIREILELLEKKQVRASFFINGTLLDNDEAGVVQKIAEAGHVIGVQGDKGALASNLLPKQGRDKFFRPFGGNLNDDMLKNLKAAGYRIIIWSVDPQDWKEDVTADDLVNVIMQQLQRSNPKDWRHSGDDIILIHLKEKYEGRTIKELRRLIRTLKREGYEIVDLPTLFGDEPTMVRQNACSHMFTDDADDEASSDESSDEEESESDDEHPGKKARKEES